MEIITAKLSLVGILALVPFAPIQIVNGEHVTYWPQSSSPLFSLPGGVYTTEGKQWDKAIVTIRNGIRTP